MSEAPLATRMRRAFGASLASQAVYFAANGALMVALTRYLLDPRGYGLLGFALSVLGVTQLLVGVGISKAGARYVTEFLETAPGQVRHVLWAVLRYVVALVVVVGSVYLVFADQLAQLLGEPALDPFLYVGVGYLAFYSLGTFARLTFQAFNRIELSAVVHATEGVSRLVFAVGFVLLGFGAVGAMLGYVAGFLVAALVGLVLFYREIYDDLDMETPVEPGLRRRLLRYSVPLTATSGADVLNKKVDTIIVGVLLANPAAVGYYTLAKQVTSFVTVPASAIDTTIAPRLGEQTASDRADRAASIYQFSVRHVLLLYIPGGVGLVLIAEPMVRHVFTPEYLPAVPVVQVFGAFIAVSAVNKITVNSLDYLGRGRERAVANGITSTTNAVLTVALVPVLGVTGAAAATVVTRLAYTLLNLHYLRQELPLHFDRLARTVGLVLGIAAGMGVAVWLSMSYISGIPSLVGVVALGVAVWGVLAVTSGVLDVRQVRAALG